MNSGIFFHYQQGNRLRDFPGALGPLLARDNVFLYDAHYPSKPPSSYELLPVPLELVLRVHTPEMVERVRAAGAFQGAIFSASGTVAAALRIYDGEIDNAFVFTGYGDHHAGTDFFGGGCYFNGAAIAIRELQRRSDAWLHKKAQLSDKDPWTTPSLCSGLRRVTATGTCHSERSEESLPGTCHSERSEESLRATCHSERSEESLPGTCHSERSEESLRGTCHSERSEESLGEILQSSTIAGRFAIVDTDAHHGDGTWQVFENDPHVLYLCFCSCGSFERGNEVNVRVPWPVTDEAYLRLVENHLARVSSFQPDLIFWNWGYDGTRGDYGDIGLSPGVHVQLARLLKQTAGAVCRGRLIVVLCGGSRRDLAASLIPGIIEVLATA